MRACIWTGVFSVLASGCSFTTAAGLDQCETSADCGADQVCTQGVCLPLPLGCGTLYGSTDPGAIQMGALVPLHTSTDPNASMDQSDEQASTPRCSRWTRSTSAASAASRSPCTSATPRTTRSAPASRPSGWWATRRWRRC